MIEETIGWGRVLADFPTEAQLLAELISEWNVVEFHFVNLLSIILSAPAPIVSPMVFAIANNRGRLDVIEAAILRLAKEADEKDIITKLLKEARAVLNIRNYYAHAMYLSHRSRGKVRLEAMSFKDYHAGKPPRKHVTVKELQREVKRTAVLAADIHAAFTVRQGLAISPKSPLFGASKHPESEKGDRRKSRTRRKPPGPSRP